LRLSRRVRSTIWRLCHTLRFFLFWERCFLMTSSATSFQVGFSGDFFVAPVSTDCFLRRPGLALAPAVAVGGVEMAAMPRFPFPPACSNGVPA